MKTGTKTGMTKKMETGKYSVTSYWTNPERYPRIVPEVTFHQNRFRAIREYLKRVNEPRFADGTVIISKTINIELCEICHKRIEFFDKLFKQCQATENGLIHKKCQNYNHSQPNREDKKDDKNKPTSRPLILQPA